MTLQRKFFLVAIILLACLALLVFFPLKSNAPGNDDKQETQTNDQQPTSSGTENQLPSPTGVRMFSDQEFSAAYDNLSHPNITPIVVAPEITGNAEVDGVIQRLAEGRGYKLRHVASGLLNSVDEIQVQELLIADWQDLRAAASADNIEIELVSGYRSVEEQRELFIERLNQLGLSNDEIVSGLADASLDQLLAVTAPPGYSRHHSGYTIDVADPAFAVFDGSEAYEWLARDNFANAKRFGFIPSYPNEAKQQGPNPESWEYVWVSKQVTYQ
jgi:LAS superfamily LD-carboxypeptidase LdcB